MNFVEVDYGSSVGVKDCYCCCKRALEHTDTHYINQNDIDKYCVEASIPVLALPKNNTEGVELLEAEDNHIDKSESRIVSRLEGHSFYLADRMCENSTQWNVVPQSNVHSGMSCDENGGYVCMYHKSEFQYHCKRPSESEDSGDSEPYEFGDSGTPSLTLSLLPVAFKFLL